MYTNVNLAAPLGALALLGAAVLLFLAAVLLTHSLVVRKPRRAKIALLLMCGITAIYLGVMLVFSFASQEKLLAKGEEKHFCELDCHLAYSVAKTAQSKSFGNGSNQLTARGQFVVITIKTRFDETTIASQRGDGELYPNGRAITLTDERGNRYAPVAQAGTSITTPLRPAEFYTTDVLFDLPADAKPTTLLMHEDAWETRLVIGHENSLLHKKTRFQV
ncbi:MAG: hypothetical protein ABR607_10085 [Pyrinomonadaceae bacterium]